MLNRTETVSQTCLSPACPPGLAQGFANQKTRAIDLARLTGGTTLRVKFTLSGRGRGLPVGFDENLLRIGQEALTNTFCHARARQFKVKLAFDEREVQLLLHDNGCGFEPAERSQSFGLKRMNERADTIGGSISVNSAKGLGTTICLRLPSHHNAKRLMKISLAV